MPELLAALIPELWYSPGLHPVFELLAMSELCGRVMAQDHEHHCGQVVSRASRLRYPELLAALIPEFWRSPGLVSTRVARFYDV